MPVTQSCLLCRVCGKHHHHHGTLRSNPPPSIAVLHEERFLPNPLFQFQPFTFTYNVVNPSCLQQHPRYTCACPHAPMHPYNAAYVDMYLHRYAYRYNEKLGMISGRAPPPHEYKNPTTEPTASCWSLTAPKRPVANLFWSTPLNPVSFDKTSTSSQKKQLETTPTRTAATQS